MKSFGLNNAHDVDIVNNTIQMANGAELKRQSVECTLHTKIGEWFLNDSLGIDFDSMLVRQKDMDEETIKAIILRGLYQVDDTFTMHDFRMGYDKKERKLSISFTVTTESGESITFSNTWG